MSVAPSPNTEQTPFILPLLKYFIIWFKKISNFLNLSVNMLYCITVEHLYLNQLVLPLNLPSGAFLNHRAQSRNYKRSNYLETDILRFIKVAALLL